MLNRNCAISETLLQPGDFNVRVTLFDKSTRYYLPTAYKQRWIETIKDSLGGGIVHSLTSQFFRIEWVKMHNPYLFEGTGNELISKIDSMFQRPRSIRITLIGNVEKSWIILIP